MAKKKTGITWTNEKRKLSDLIPWERNPRTIKNAQAERLVDSVETFGQVETLAINPDNGVLNGHQRLSVLAGQYGMDYEVDVRVASRELTERERQQLTVYLHKGAAGDWQPKMLFEHFEFDDLTAWGFDTEELDAMFADLQPETAGASADTEPQIDKADELRQKWGVELGQMWQLGDHRIICGDCTDPAVVARVMGGEKAQSIVTSPPYNQNLDTFRPSGMQKENPSFVNRMAASYSDSMPESEYQDWQKSLLRLWKNHVTENGSCFYNHKIRYRDKSIITPIMWLIDCGWHIRQEIIWDRGSSITLNARMFIPADERIYWLRAGDDFVFNDTPDIKAWSTVWEVAAKNDVQVSAAFATEIPTRCIKASTTDGDIVAEPFSGSGTTIIACQNLNRRCRAVEISPGYTSVAIERFFQHTGIQPELLT